MLNFFALFEKQKCRISHFQWCPYMYRNCGRWIWTSDKSMLFISFPFLFWFKWFLWMHSGMGPLHCVILEPWSALRILKCFYKLISLLFSNTKQKRLVKGTIFMASMLSGRGSLTKNFLKTFLYTYFWRISFSCHHARLWSIFCSIYLSWRFSPYQLDKRPSKESDSFLV